MHTKILTFQTKEFFQIENITSLVEDFLKEIKATSGLVNVYVQHTTVAIKINEDEAGFFADIKRVLSEEICPPSDAGYQHNDLESRDPKTLCPISKEECLNGHSHVSQMLIGTASETIPVVNGEMQLGRWQQILMIELDHARERNVMLSFLGETS
ncbi:YjbQ family protein [bacterium]|nr:YjbQ family protein [bacterium]NCQ55429.1 YjbQ family protein [Candidatus Parcubacteria bacterium]NCS67791.1 YjbQ family protein [Candidatus Peregrinibacteria bacterium]NCS96395.1 YjbQ family protein [bacterium]